MKELSAIILLSTLLMQPGAFAADPGMNMQEHMQEMKTLMATIKAEQDPAKLETLKQQHMELMHEGMQMMSQNHGASSEMMMEARMQGMEQRMEMMQMMMGQMMDHNKEEIERPVHQHNR